MTPAQQSLPQAPYAYGIKVTGRCAPCVLQLDEQYNLIGLHRYNPLLNTLGAMEKPWGFPKYKGVLFHNLAQAKSALIDCLLPE